MSRIRQLLDDDIPRFAGLMRELPQLCTDFDGKIERGRFWFATCFIALSVFLIERWLFRLVPLNAPAIAIAVSALSLYPYSALATARARDRGHGDLWGVMLVLACVITGILVNSLARTPYAATVSIVHICVWLYTLFDLGLMPGRSEQPRIEIGERLPR
ncbi:MAG: DUF805 domain-containing protein [Bosea sp. (in: a-proteobacteria)]